MIPKILLSTDSIAELDAGQKLEIRDYVNMRCRRLPTIVKWNYIKSMVVTKHGETLWQLSERYIDALNARAIGTIESPVHLFEWILKECDK